MRNLKHPYRYVQYLHDIDKYCKIMIWRELHYTRLFTTRVWSSYPRKNYVEKKDHPENMLPTPLMTHQVFSHQFHLFTRNSVKWTIKMYYSQDKPPQSEGSHDSVLRRTIFDENSIVKTVSKSWDTRRDSESSESYQSTRKVQIIHELP